MTDLKMSDIPFERPDYETIKSSYDDLFLAIDVNENLSDVVKAWDTIRKRLTTYKSIATIRTRLDSNNEAHKAEKEFSTELEPKLIELEIAMKRKLLKNRDFIVSEFGQHLFDLWSTDILTYKPEIQDDLVDELKRVAEYMGQFGKSEIECFGETFSLSTITKFNADADREKRYVSAKAKWDWFSENKDKNDKAFDELVKLRTKMAKGLGHENYINLGYQRMQRIGYSAIDVATFRAEVLKTVVPLVNELKEEQRERIGVDKLMFWDQSIGDPRGAPKPQGEPDALVAAAKTMFDSMHPDLGTFFRSMDDRNLMDLDARAGKMIGGFCSDLPTYGTSFVFANFNGTKNDVKVLTHEIGHAFQNHIAHNTQPISDFYWPTSEAAEIHSMSLEYLAWPHMDKFFGEDAQRFCKEHLAYNLSFMPYACAVDEFQHQIYENPNMTAEERHAIWKKVEELYMPYLDWGDIEHGAMGRSWHSQVHIFMRPFYYIDYVLALTCALQFWELSQNDERVMDRYVQLCRRGGEAPFEDLLKSAGLKSPFEEGCLVSVVECAKAFLK